MESLFCDQTSGTFSLEATVNAFHLNHTESGVRIKNGLGHITKLLTVNYFSQKPKNFHSQYSVVDRDRISQNER